MGVVIQCNNKVIHYTYEDLFVFKKELIQACVCYLHNEIYQNSHSFENIKINIIGIYLFIYKNNFSSIECSLFLNSLYHVQHFIHLTQNMNLFICMFLYSVKTNTQLLLL
jgi:hypothetical protein